MKTLRLICVASLLANAALATALLYQKNAFAAAASTSTKTQDKIVPLTPEDRSRVAAVATLKTALQNNDAQTVRDQLRALGFPDDAVRSMVRAIVYRPLVNLQKSFTDAQRRDGNPYLAMPLGMFSFESLTREQRAKFIDASRQAEHDVEALVGVDPLDARQNRFSFLGPEKAAKLRDLDRDYSEMRSKLMSDTAGFRVPADDEKMNFLQEEQRRDLANLLTPEEMKEYDLRTSTTANRVRSQLHGFDASEAEYKAIFEAQKALDDRARNVGTGTNLSGQSFADAQKAANEQIHAALGDERYKEYLRNRNPDYQALNAAAKRFDLPPAAVDQAFAARDQTISNAQRIANDTTLDADQRRAALTNLVTQTRNQLRTSLGEEAADAYMKTNMRWLDEVQRGTPISVNQDGLVSTRSNSAKSGNTGRPVMLAPGQRPE